MPITSDRLRELAARGESTMVDFKLADYDWSRKQTNNELAKDLTAMANALGPSAGPAYILVGVREDDGALVGIADHQDDADLHQRVYGILNALPRFVYGAVAVDGVTVGVYEITAGGRPYFPLRDAPPLYKHVGVVRSGTTTIVASPAMILEWQREDDPVAHELREQQLLRLRADAAVHGTLTPITMQAGSKDVAITMQLRNTGRSGFWIDVVEWEVEWLPRFWLPNAHSVGLRSEIPPDYSAPKGVIEHGRSGLLPPNDALTLEFRWDKASALEHFVRAGLLVNGFNGSWAAYNFVARCRTDLGGEGVIRGRAAQ